MPFTIDDFDQQMEEAIELMDMLGDAEIKYAINGLLSADTRRHAVFGRIARRAQSVVSRCGLGQGGPGMAQVVAEWMTYGYPRVIDPHASDIARFYDDEKNDEHIWARSAEHFNKTYGIVHPSEQWESRRGLKESSLKAITDAAGAEYFHRPSMGTSTLVRQQC